MVGLWNEAAGGLVPGIRTWRAFTRHLLLSSKNRDHYTRELPWVESESCGSPHRQVSLATWRMFDRLSRATEYGRVIFARQRAAADSLCAVLFGQEKFYGAAATFACSASAASSNTS